MKKFEYATEIIEWVRYPKDIELYWFNLSSVLSEKNKGKLKRLIQELGETPTDKIEAEKLELEGLKIILDFYGAKSWEAIKIIPRPGAEVAPDISTWTIIFKREIT